MKIVIKNAKLSNLLKKVSGGISRNKKDILLSCILFRVIGDKIFCIAINETYEIVTYDFLDYTLDEIEIIVEYNLISNISKKTSLDSNITIVKKKKIVEIFTDTCVFKFISNIETFPSFDFVDLYIFRIKIKMDELQKLLRHVRISIAIGHIQRFFNGVLFDVSNNSLNCLSSDKSNLSFCSLNFTENIYDSLKTIIPRSTINEVLNTFCDTKYIYIIFYNNQIKFVTARTTIISKLINDVYSFPNIYLDMSDSIKLKLNTLDMKKALDKINIIKVRDDKVTLSLINNKIFIKAGDFNQNITIMINSDINIINFDVSFNYKHLLEILKLIDCFCFDFFLINNRTIILVKEFKSNFFHMIMPFNI